MLIQKLKHFFRLTLVLSCAMKFETFPHDTQVCSMMIESCKMKLVYEMVFHIFSQLFYCFKVSHTTEDLIFRWNHTDPLVVNEAIELPQLDISRNGTEDCTLEYSTGNHK